MLRILEPADTLPPLAYRVPWRVDRDDPAHPLLVNDGAEVLAFVRAYIADADAPPRVEAWGRLSPGAARPLCLCDCDLDDTTVTLAWFRADDAREWAWSFAV